MIVLSGPHTHTRAHARQWHHCGDVGAPGDARGNQRCALYNVCAPQGLQKCKLAQVLSGNEEQRTLLVHDGRTKVLCYVLPDALTRYRCHKQLTGNLEGGVVGEMSEQNTQNTQQTPYTQNMHSMEDSMDLDEHARPRPPSLTVLGSSKALVALDRWVWSTSVICTADRGAAWEPSDGSGGGMLPFCIQIHDFRHIGSPLPNSTLILKGAHVCTRACVHMCWRGCLKCVVDVCAGVAFADAGVEANDVSKEDEVQILLRGPLRNHKQCLAALANGQPNVTVDGVTCTPGTLPDAHGKATMPANAPLTIDALYLDDTPDTTPTAVAATAAPMPMGTTSSEPTGDIAQATASTTSTFAAGSATAAAAATTAQSRNSDSDDEWETQDALVRQARRSMGNSSMEDTQNGETRSNPGHPASSILPSVLVMPHCSLTAFWALVPPFSAVFRSCVL